MSSIRDYCPECKGMGWECRCGDERGQKPTPVTDRDELVERALFYRQANFGPHKVGYALISDLIARIQSDAAIIARREDELRAAYKRGWKDCDEDHAEQGDEKLHFDLMNEGCHNYLSERLSSEASL